MTTARTPFCWQDKRVLRVIHERCPDPASAIGVYVALTVVASDVQKEEFQTTYAWLASLSGFSARTVQSRVHDLAALGVIAVKVPPLKGPITYRLLPFGNGCLTSSNGCRAIGNGTTLSLPPPLPASEERRVNNQEKKEFAQPSASLPSPLPVVDSPLPKRTKQKKPADPRHREFIEAWMPAYKERFGEDYTGMATAGGKEGAILSRFLTACEAPVGSLIEVAKRAWSHPEFNCQRAVTITVFCCSYGGIQKELSKPAASAAPALPPPPTKTTISKTL